MGKIVIISDYKVLHSDILANVIKTIANLIDDMFYEHFNQSNVVVAFFLIKKEITRINAHWLQRHFYNKSKLVLIKQCIS